VEGVRAGGRPLIASGRGTNRRAGFFFFFGGAAPAGAPPSALINPFFLFHFQLALYDIANVAGVAADLSHCNTAVQVRGGGRKGGKRSKKRRGRRESTESIA
jgi:hypothetical protein